MQATHKAPTIIVKNQLAIYLDLPHWMAHIAYIAFYSKSITIQYNTRQYYTRQIQYYKTQDNTIQYKYYTIVYKTILYNTHAILYNTIQYNNIQHNTIQHITILYNTILYNTTQYYRKTIRMTVPISGCSSQWVRSPPPAPRGQQGKAPAPDPKVFSKGRKHQDPPVAQAGMEVSKTETTRASTQTTHRVKP